MVIFAGEFLQKSGSVTYNHIWTPNTMLSFRKKLMSQFRENLWTWGRTDRQTDRQTCFYRTLPAEAGWSDKKACSYYFGRKVVFRKWILVVSVLSRLVVILFSVRNVRSGFITVVLMWLGRSIILSTIIISGLLSESTIMLKCLSLWNMFWS